MVAGKRAEPIVQVAKGCNIRSERLRAETSTGAPNSVWSPLIHSGSRRFKERTEIVEVVGLVELVELVSSVPHNTPRRICGDRPPIVDNLLC